jgi:type II secretory pathway pseudopilin PulG
MGLIEENSEFGTGSSACRELDSTELAEVSRAEQRRVNPMIAISSGNDELDDRPIRRGVRRRGWTLVEILVVMSFGAGLTGLTITMLAGALRASGQAMDQVAEHGVTSRLAERFRADVAAASDCRPLEEPAGNPGQRSPGIVLQGAGESRVEYRSSGNVLERMVLTGEHVDRRESYWLGRSRQARLGRSSDSPAIVRCSLEATTTGENSTATTVGHVTIAATLGRDHRYRQADGGTTEKQPVPPSAEPKKDEPADAEEGQ